MKNFFLSVFAALTLSGAFASGPDRAGEIPAGIRQSFEKFFPAATDVSWEDNNLFSCATFRFEGKVLSAYFNKDDETLAAISRNLRPDQLPLQLSAALRSQCRDCWLTDLVEVVINGETRYYATLENDKRKICLESGTNEWVRTSCRKK